MGATPHESWASNATSDEIFLGVYISQQEGEAILRSRWIGGDPHRFLFAS